MGLKKEILLVFLVFLLNLLTAVAGSDLLDTNRLIVNSEDWKDVYSVLLFSNLASKPASFLTSTPHSTIILNQINRDNHLHLISSDNIPFIVGYKGIVESRGYTADEYVMNNINLELADDLDVENFIIIDASYGYNAIAVAPYASISDSYVLFADRNNIGAIVRFLSARTVDNLIIYGTTDREVIDRLSQYNPEIINKDGDRFDNNVEIVKKYREINPAKQVILTNGEFIETEIMKGEAPVLFIGRNNVPDQIKEYIQGTDIEVGVLIGNELVGTATTVRRQVGISTFVKFAQGARSPRGAISQVEALDMFYMPSYLLNLELFSARYNRLTSQLEITIRNNADLASYFKGTYTINAGTTSKTVGDIDSVFVTGNGFKTIVYDVGNLPEGPMKIEVFIIYGESKKSLEFTIQQTIDVDTVQILDKAEITLNTAIYDKGKKAFIIEVENIGTVDAFVDVELTDILVVGERLTFGSGSQPVKVGKTEKFNIVLELTDEELIDNNMVTINTFYGQRENALTKLLETRMEITIISVNYVKYALIAGIIILVLFLGRKFLLRKRKEA